MDESLVITLNRDGPHSIDVADRPFETTDSFDIVLDNRGEALHVHLHLDDELARTASIATGNHYVQQGAVRRVRVDVQDGRRPVEGRLEVVTGYGAERTWVDVGIVDPAEVDQGVRVDESLGRPQPTVEREPAIDVSALPVVAVAGLALLIAITTLIWLDGLAVALGALVVIVGLGAAVIFLLR